jgi:hypothetical protein
LFSETIAVVPDSCFAVCVFVIRILLLASFVEVLRIFSACSTGRPWGDGRGGMVDTLVLIGLSWVTFNVAVGAAVAVLLLTRAVRRKKSLRDSGIAGLMAVHRQAEKPPFERNVVTLRRPSPESSSSISRPSISMRKKLGRRRPTRL